MHSGLLVINVNEWTTALTVGWRLQNTFLSKPCCLEGLGLLQASL